MSAMSTRRARWASIISLSLALVGCDDTAPNNPHTDFKENENIRFGVFTESPKTLDPARSYSSNEIRFTAQIVEPLLQYHLTKRPYTLIPLTATSMPQVSFYDKQDQLLPAQANLADIAYTVYDIHLKDDIYYQPHPAFAKRENNQYRYHQLAQTESEQSLDDINALSDFFYTDTRKLTAHDYAYQIKRLADPLVRSPIYGLMSEHIQGLKEFNAAIQQRLKAQNGEDAITDLQQQTYIDLREIDLSGVKVIDDHHFQIRINGRYAQFMFWLAMPFFAPTPWEADRFYQQPILQDKNITLDWYPVGTGPYRLVENNPNARMVLARNPNYQRSLHDNQLPENDDPIPRIDKHVFSLEKESIPQWTKFLQGYYDFSGISADSFDQAIQIDANGKPSLTPELAERGIRLYTTVEPSIFYMGFNMLDPIVGGDSERARKLRQAIRLAVDYDEYISIFLNGRGIPANGPIPPGIVGYQPPETTANAEQRLAQAKQLLREAGYANGRDPQKQQPLILNYDVPATSGPGEKAVLNWTRKQFAKLGIQLHVRATQYNRFQEKMRTGQAQIYSWGWSADYPDPENFLFLFYSPNGKVKFGGENASNYTNPQFDQLFETMRDLDNGPERLHYLQQMVAILQQDTPWVWGFYPKRFELSHAWMSPYQPNAFANNTLQYLQLDPNQRQRTRSQWNQPLIWPGVLLAGAFILFFLPVLWQYRQRGQQPFVKRVKS